LRGHDVEVREHAREAEAVHETEAECPRPAVALLPALHQVGDRDGDDRCRDARFDEQARQPHEARRRAEQRQRVGDRERRDRRDDAPPRQTADQQREQEREVVVPDQDVLDAEREERAGLCEPRGHRRGRDRERERARVQQRVAGDRACVVEQRRVAAVAMREQAQERHLQHRVRFGPRERERQLDVLVLGELGGEQICGDADAARREQHELRAHELGQRGSGVRELERVERAVAVPIERRGRAEVGVRERDVHAEPVAAAGDLQRAEAGIVGDGCCAAGEHERREKGAEVRHGSLREAGPLPHATRGSGPRTQSWVCTRPFCGVAAYGITLL
jgi:hypothetical protein